jgi:ABC-type multidrug transport system fused ATPase/permease subunit
VARDPEPRAFAKACTYLNYNAPAKWAALTAGAASSVVYVLLLVLLLLFTDLLVTHGRIPNYHGLTAQQQARFQSQWEYLDDATRKEQLQQVAHLSADEAEKRKSAAIGELTREEVDDLWRAHVGQVLDTYKIGTEQKRADMLEPKHYDEIDRGFLGLLIRYEANGDPLTPVVATIAQWNPWMWNASSDRDAPIKSYLIGLVAVAFLLTALGTGLIVLMREMAARATTEAATRLRRGVYHHTFRLGTLAFRALGPSEAVTVFTRHVEAVHDALYARLTVYFREPIKFGLLLLFAFMVHPLLALAFLIFAVLVWLIGGQISSYFRRTGKLATNRAGERLAIMRESLMIMRLVKCYLMEQFNQARVERQLSQYARIQLVRLRGEALSQPLLIFLAMLCALNLLFVAGVIVLNGTMGVARMVALATALLSLYRPLRNWLDARRILRRGEDSARQVFRFLDRKSDVGQVVGAEFLPPLAKKIEFDNVSLREPGADRMLLEEVSLTIPAGQRIGLIGPDDLEKHALVYLLARLLDPSAGEIRIDQHNLRWVTLDSLRNQMATVLQHNLVFHDTVANNIGCGDSAFTLPKIIEAAKIAHAHHFIQGLPQGYETPIGELGHSLTVDQQFRIALARAVLRDPALLIIEEPAITLDEDVKNLLDDTFTRMLPGRTAIFLPHRISTIRSCDRLFLLHKGHVVASGIHKELLAENPLYRHLHYLEFNEMVEQL